jgi:hypothetical protein
MLIYYNCNFIYSEIINQKGAIAPELLHIAYIS